MGLTIFLLSLFICFCFFPSSLSLSSSSRDILSDPIHHQGRPNDHEEEIGRSEAHRNPHPGKEGAAAGRPNEDNEDHSNHTPVKDNNTYEQIHDHNELVHPTPHPSTRHESFKSPADKEPRQTNDQSILQLLNEGQNPTKYIGPIPSIVHYVYGLREANSVTFIIDEYLAIKSALDIVQAEKVIIWHRNLPQSDWWNKTMELGRLRAQERNLNVSNIIELRQVRDVSTVFGQPVESSAHKADVIRLEALLMYGGVYMDMDVIAIKPFTLLLNHPSGCVLGEEKLSFHPHPHGLGNACIICHKFSPFLQEWYSAYKKFDHTQWAALSVHLPLQLSRSYPYLVHALGPNAFYRPMYDTPGKDELYVRNEYDLSGNYAVHLWSGGRRLRALTPNIESLCQLNTTYGRIARTVLLAGGKSDQQTCNGRGIE